MQTSRISWIALAAAIAAAGLGGGAALARTVDKTVADPASRADLNVQTLSGAYLAAKSAQSDGDLDIATDYFDKALAIDPNSDLLRREALLAYIAEGRFTESTRLAAKLSGDEEAGKVARMTLGIQALADGRFTAALRELSLNEPSDLDALLLGHLSSWAEAGAGRFDAAFSRIASLEGASWFAIFNGYQTGLLATLSGDTERARTALAAVVADPAQAQTSAETYLAAVEALARLEARAGNRDAALAAIGKGLELVPTYDALTHLKTEIEGRGTIAPAIRDAQDGAAETLYLIGQAINRGDGQQVALLYFQFARAVSRTPDPKLLTALAGIAERNERIDLALSYYEQVPKDSAYRRLAELQMGLDLWYAERKDEAKAHLREAVADYPRDLQAHLALADVLSADKNWSEAAGILEQAVAIAPKGEASNWNVYYQRGIAYERLKEWNKAEPDFRTALELSPNQPQVLNYLGYSWVDMNRNLDEGLDMIRTAVDQRPNDGYIIDSLGWAYFRLARDDDAVEQLERAVLITPADPTINDHLGDAYWRVGREREARFQWQRALGGTPAPEPADAERIRAKLVDGLSPAVKGADAEIPPGERAASGAPAGGPVQPN